MDTLIKKLIALSSELRLIDKILSKNQIKFSISDDPKGFSIAYKSTDSGASLNLYTACNAALITYRDKLITRIKNIATDISNYSA